MLNFWNVKTAPMNIPRIHLTTIPAAFGLSVDGYDRVDPDGSAFKNQIIGLLQAVGYLKG